MDQKPLGQYLARGRNAEVYAWEPGQVIKLFYERVSPEAVAHEIEIGRVIAAKTLPTPKMLGSCTVEGRAGIVYERVDGQTMLSLMGQKPWLIPRMGRQLAEVQSAIHRQSGSGLPVLRARLGRTIRRVENLPQELKTKALDALEQLPDGEALCHFDLHPDQVMISPSGPVAIDWENASQGDPLGDVARTMIMTTIGAPLDANLLMLALARLANGIFRRSYFKRYLELNPGAQVERIRAWLVPVAAARLREHIPGEEPHLLRMIREQ